MQPAAIDGTGTVWCSTVSSVVPEVGPGPAEQECPLKVALSTGVMSVKVVEIGVEFEVAMGQAARGGSLPGSASSSGDVSSAIPSICM